MFFCLNKRALGANHIGSARSPYLSNGVEAAAAAADAHARTRARTRAHTKHGKLVVREIKIAVFVREL